MPSLSESLFAMSVLNSATAHVGGGGSQEHAPWGEGRAERGQEIKGDKIRNRGEVQAYSEDGKYFEQSHG